MKFFRKDSMGRTVTPYSVQIETVRARFQNFRRALRKSDQDIFDELFRYAKGNVQAGVMAASPNPADSVFLAILMELRRQLQVQEARINDLEKELKFLKTTNPRL
jgi:hypothetical protein